jgi:hypothetical protein
MRRALVIGGVAVLVAATLAGCGGGGGKKTETDFEKANTSLLGTIPVYPHAKLKTHASTGYTTGSTKVLGYQTRYIYTLPAQATLSDVEGFYLRSLQSWKQVASLTGPVLNYRKGKSFISVNLTAVKTHTLEIVVDDSFYANVPKG